MEDAQRRIGDSFDVGGVISTDPISGNGPRGMRGGLWEDCGADEVWLQGGVGVGHAGLYGPQRSTLTPECTGYSRGTMVRGQPTNWAANPLSL